MADFRVGAKRRRFVAGLGLVLLLGQAFLFAPPALAATFTVAVYDNAYVSGDITINAGDTVQWVFRHNPPNRNSHSVTAQNGSFDSGSTTCPPICSEDPLFHTFGYPGDYPYFCRVHPGIMNGVVRVQPASGPPSSPQSSGFSQDPPPPSQASGSTQSAPMAPPPPPSYPTVLGSSSSVPTGPSEPGPAGSPLSPTSASPTPAPAVPSLTESLTEPAGDIDDDGDGIGTIFLGRSRPLTTESQDVNMPPIPAGVTPVMLMALAAVLLLAGAFYGKVIKRRILAMTTGGAAAAVAIETIAGPRILSPGPEPAPQSVREEGAPQNASLRREGDIWTIEWQETVLRLNHSKGLEDLSKLLLNPGREYHVLELAVENGFSSGPDRGQPERSDLSIRAHDAGAVLDPKAKEGYRQRLRDLEEEVAEADEYNDPERASRARSEIDFIARELSAAVGLGGRDRRVDSDLERARVLVTKRIRRAIEKIASKDKALGEHLQTCIKTGTYCVYLHEASVALKWGG